MSRPSDVWSLGCILYQMTYQRTPFQKIDTVAKKLAAISDPKVPIEFKWIPDTHLLTCIKSCLERDSKKRMTIAELLKHPYLRPEAILPHTTEITKISTQILTRCSKLGVSDPELTDLQRQLERKITLASL